MKTRTLGLILPAYSRYTADILAGARDALARRHAWDLALFRYMYLGPSMCDAIVAERWAGAVVGPMQPVEFELVEDALANAGVPMVSLRYMPVHLVPTLIIDYASCGRMAAEHLMDRGYRHIIHFVAGDMWHSRRLDFGVRDACAARGVAFTCFLEGPRTQARGLWQLSDQIADFAEALMAFDQPVGVVGSNGTQGERAMRAASAAGLRVPEDVGVIALEQDDLFCECCTPSLSSVLADHEGMGRCSVETLIRLIETGVVPKDAQRVPAMGTVTRQSTDHTAVDDALVSAAIRFIRDHLDQPLTIDDVAAAAAVSRSTLIRRFQSELGRSPAHEIRRLRIDHVKDLLVRTRWPLARIAVESGHGTVRQLANVFKRSVGLTPTQYRRKSGA